MEVAMFDELSSEDEKKKWLFKENVRLQELSRNLEDERKLIEIQMGMLQRQQSKNMLLKKQLESQKDLFEQNGIFWRGKQDSLQLIKISLSGKSLYIRTRFTVKQGAVCLMLKM